MTGSRVIRLPSWEDAVPKATGITMVIEGRTFVQDVPTFEQELYIMDRATACGLTSFKGLAFNPDKDDLEEVVKQMIVTAYRSGEIFRLIGAMVTEEGTEWSVEQAEASADLFRKTRDPEAKRLLQPALVGAIIAFFESAAPSDPTSLTSFIPIEESPSEDARPRSRQFSDGQADALFRMGTTKSPLSPSPTTTDSIPESSSAPGKSATASVPTKTSSKSKPGTNTAKRP